MTFRQSVRSGFTLLELMIVVSIAAIMASIALPRINLGQYKADAAMRVTQSALQQSERNAVQRQVEVAVSFDTANNRIRVLYDLNDNHAVDVGEEVQWRSLEEGSRFSIPPVGVNGPVSAPITSGTIGQSPEGYPTVYYHRDGASSTSYEVYLQSYTNNLNDFRALVITQATGHVDLYRYNSSSGMWVKADM